MTFDDALSRLVTTYEQGRLTPFVGLGISAGTCSSWKGFIATLAKVAQAEGLGDFSAIQNVPDAELPQSAHRIVAVLRRKSPDKFPGWMREALYKKTPTDTTFLTPVVTKLASIWWPLVLTTNYDDLLFRASLAEFGGWSVLGRSGYDCARVVASLHWGQPGPP